MFLFLDAAKWCYSLAFDPVWDNFNFIVLLIILSF